jgi:serine/threonine-protein kinase
VSLAVHYAHARGVIHRDLKPSNIMVGELGEVYVLDWGVARSGDLAPPTGETVQAVVEGADATRHGTVIGSVAYMAPEQLAGRLDRIGPATDVYALGAIAFEALTGHRVHPAEPPRRPEDAVDVAARLRAHDSDLAPELTVVIQRALARDVDERLGSARELAEAFERFTAGDRDRERREALSREAAARARSKLGHGAPHARADAMREVGRALALDPDNHTAIEVLVDLLSTPPLEVPEEVESALEETVSRGTRTMARTAMWAYAVVPPFFLVALWMGVRDIRVLALIAAVVAVAIGVIALGRRRQHGRRSLAPSLVLASSFIALSSGVFGPFVITPLLTQVAFAFFVLHLGARHLPHLIALAAAVVLVPAGLQWASVLPSSYRFEAGELVVSPIFVEFPPVPTLVMLAGGSVAALAVGLASLAAFRLLLRDAERRAQMQAWQISRLLPEVRQGVGRFVGG